MKCMRELECKILGLQDSIMLKVREVSAAREVQTCLRAEIESYKVLLEREEKRRVIRLIYEYTSIEIINKSCLNVSLFVADSA